MHPLWDIPSPARHASYSTYYKALVRAILAPRHLSALRRWLGGDYPPLGACLTPDLAFPRDAEAWLYCFGQVSLTPKKSGRGAAEPVAMYKALLAHPGCQAGLRALTETQLAGVAWGRNPGQNYTVTLFALFACVPQGARLIQKCAEQLGYFDSSPSAPLGDAWRCAWDTFGDYLEEHLLPKALRWATLPDVKRLLSLGPRLAEAFRPRPDWAAAARSARRDVFEFALERAAAGRWAPDQWLGNLWDAPITGAVRAERAARVLGLVPAQTVAGVLAACTPGRPGEMALLVARDCAARGRGDYLGLDAYLQLEYPSARVAREFAALLLEPGWASAWCRAPLPPAAGEAGGASLWVSGGCLAPCCVRPSCPLHRFNRGLHALTSGPEFAARERWEQTALVEKLAAVHLCATAYSANFVDDACLWDFAGRAPQASPRRVVAMALRWGGLRIATTDRGRKGFELSFPRDKTLLQFMRRAGLGGACAVALALSGAARGAEGPLLTTLWAPRDSRASRDSRDPDRAAVRLKELRDVASRYAWGLAGLRGLVRGAMDRRAFGAWKRNTDPIRHEIAMLPPDPKVCATGGTAYRSSLRSFSGVRFRPPPAHASPELLAWYLARPATVSPKADGVLYEGPLPAGAFPPPRAWAWDSVVRAEVVVIRGTPVYLIFDLLAPALADETLLERMALARDAFPSPVPEPASGASAEDALTSLAAERAALAELVDLAGPGQAVWWPKWVAPLPREGALRLLAGQPGALYPTDGWVLTPLASHAELAGKGAACPPDAKVKPAREMTADLAVGGAVWRCEWAGAEGAGGWRPREPRPEKREANPPALVAFLGAYHRAPWGPLDLAPCLGAGHYRGPAAARPALGAATRAFLGEQRALQAARVSALCPGRRVLDVGAGRGRLAARCPGAASWTGLDVDPVCVVDARHRAATRGKGDWLWCDAGTLASPLGARPRALAPAAFDLLLCVHSAHHGAASEATWQAWVANLTYLAAPGAVLLVRTIDPALLPDEPARLPDGSFVRRLAGAYPGATAVRSSLAWAASAAEPVTELYLDLGLLADTLQAAGWDCLEVSRQGETVSEPWAAWALSHVWLVFGRSA